MNMVSKGPDELSKKDELRGGYLNWSDCIFKILPSNQTLCYNVINPIPSPKGHSSHQGWVNSFPIGLF